MPEIGYRIGTHPDFLSRMRRALAGEEATDGNTPLAGLSLRSPADDPAIALLDATAIVADVLTFYQERIANEGFLRTAAERRSVLEIARSIGCELSPGVAATAYLAFKVTDAPTMQRTVVVPQATAVQSIPPQGELPQTFETEDEITASVDLNAIVAQQSVSQVPANGTETLYLEGILTNLDVGDALLIVGAEREAHTSSERWDLRFVTEVTPDPVEKYTIVTLDAALGHEDPDMLPAAAPRVYALRQRAALFGNNAPDWRMMPENVQTSFGGGNEWPNFSITTLNPPRIDLDAAYPKIFNGSWLALSRPGFVQLYRADEVVTQPRTDFSLTARCTRAALDTNDRLNWFGLRETVVFAQSEELTLAGLPVTEPVLGDEVSFDGVVDGLVEGGFLAFSGPPAVKAVVTDRSIVVRTGSTEVTRAGSTLTLVADDGAVRTLVPGDELEPVGPPEATTSGDLMWRFRTIEDFEGTISLSPRSNALAWADPEDDALPVSEIAEMKEVVQSADRTAVVLKAPLKNLYDRASLRINGNVVLASHGETVANEVLGSGDGASANQRFKLRKPPLTYVTASTPSGVETTLVVRANGLLWEDVDSLYAQASDASVYTVRLDDDATAWVIFGDGVSGARLPSGAENVTATYRSGIGLDGEVADHTLSLLKNRPQGIQEVTNPVAASGAEDPEELASARTNAPRTVLTLDRVVSLRDYEDFARAFAGLAKARAANIWRGETHLVHLTVASTSGDALPSTSPLRQNLVDAIEGAYDPRHPFIVDDYESLTFDLSASIKVDARYIADDVLADVRNELVSAFSFSMRKLAEPLTAAEVITAVHGVSGVIAVTLTELHLTGSVAGDDPEAIIPAQPGRLDSGTGAMLPAQLITINEDALVLIVMEEA